MNETIKKLRTKASDLEIELSDLYAMSEERACDYYQVNYKEEAITLINEELAEAYKAIDEAEERERAEMEDELYHFAFPTERDFWAYKGF